MKPAWATINRTQPLLVLVRNEKLCGLQGIEIELTVEGRGDLSQHGDREGEHRAKSLRSVTNEEGKVQARFHPTNVVGESCVIKARIAGMSSVAASSARFTTAPEFHKVTLGPDGFFVRPDRKRTLPLGGQFLPQVKKVVNGKTAGVLGVNTIGCEEARQREWFEYLQQHGVNCLRGYWAWGRPLELGSGGAVVPGTLYLDGKINEPVVGALERTMGIGGQYGVAFTLTIANCARPFIAPGHRGADRGDKSKRMVAHEADEFLREFVPRWKLPAESYSLTVWDLDTGQKTEIPNAGQMRIWRQEQTDHDFVLMWQTQG